MKTVLKPGENVLPPIFEGIPIIYEDDEFEEILMGENLGHYEAGGILYFCLKAHLKRYFPDLLAACNLNCYYRDKPKSKKSGRKPYFSADVMVVPEEKIGRLPTSYTIGLDGPPPFFVCEILSQLSGKIRDPIEKPEIYAKLGVSEYLLIDELGRFLPQPLLLKRLREDRTWQEILDDDGGVTSQLGFRVIHDGRLHVINAQTGEAYVRPDDAENEIHQMRSELQSLADVVAKTESEKRALLEEIARLQKKRNSGGT